MFAESQSIWPNFMAKKNPGTLYQGCAVGFQTRLKVLIQMYAYGSGTFVMRISDLEL